MCIKVMCREYTLFDNNNFRPKRTVNLRDYIKQDVYTYESGAEVYLCDIIQYLKERETKLNSYVYRTLISVIL